LRLLSDGKRALANLIKQWLALRDCLALSRPAPRRGWQMPRHPGAHRGRDAFGDDNVASCSIARRLGELRATLNKVLGLRLGAVIDREVVPGCEPIGGYWASKPDEADLHRFMPPSPL
jgi:hypothetical protein